MDNSLIKRQEAIDALGEEPDIWNDTEEEWAYRNAWVEHIAAVKALPSADRPTGKWIYNDKLGTFKIFTCSVCGINMEAEWDYCPNCGAKMESETTEVNDEP